MRVGLFVTCLIDLMRPRIGFAALRLLEAAGCEVVVPATQTCCGQPGYNAGARGAAQALARKVLDEFDAFEYVVVPSGSCAGMIRTHYPELLADQPAELARVQRLASRTYELTDFLLNVVKLEKVPGAYNGTVTYHDSCSGLRELDIKAQPRALLAKVAGLKLKEMNEAETCCGFGGTFALKFGEISAHIAERKCGNISASGADAVVLGDLGCMLNIEGRLRRRGDMSTKVLHVAEVLAGVEERPHINANTRG
ncbi:MAG: Fe-S oxidoreductase [Betaproteobacteria bacterium SG8_41]|nr:MAG: Fe-S oxidoreductase [Betaproteobacteria bacterium SG8_41]